jgi:hypothetical protein
MAPVGVTYTVAVASSFLEEVESFFPSSMLCKGGGGMMEYITWRDLVDIATLVITVISLLISNKKR